MMLDQPDTPSKHVKFGLLCCPCLTLCWWLADACCGAVSGIKAIKLYAWEEPYLARITQLRERELQAIKRTQMLAMVSHRAPHPVIRRAAANGWEKQTAALDATACLPACLMLKILSTCFCEASTLHLLGASTGHKVCQPSALP
jgi:hypothetical protein